MHSMEVPIAMHLRRDRGSLCSSPRLPAEAVTRLGMAFEAGVQPGPNLEWSQHERGWNWPLDCTFSIRP